MVKTMNYFEFLVMVLQEGLLVEKVVTVADDFIWPTGDKRCFVFSKMGKHNEIFANCDSSMRIMIFVLTYSARRKSPR